eukprot:gene20018-7109_t
MEICRATHWIRLCLKKSYQCQFDNQPNSTKKFDKQNLLLDHPRIQQHA